MPIKLNRYLLLYTIILLCTYTLQESHALTCRYHAKTSDYKKSFDSSDVIFVGKVIDIQKYNNQDNASVPSQEMLQSRDDMFAKYHKYKETITLEVYKSWKGINSKTINLSSIEYDGMGSNSFSKNKTYLIFATKQDTHILHFPCSIAKEVSPTYEIIHMLNNLNHKNE